MVVVWRSGAGSFDLPPPRVLPPWLPAPWSAPLCLPPPPLCLPPPCPLVEVRTAGRLSRREPAALERLLPAEARESALAGRGTAVVTVVTVEPASAIETVVAAATEVVVTEPIVDGGAAVRRPNTS